MICVSWSGIKKTNQTKINHIILSTEENTFWFKKALRNLQHWRRYKSSLSDFRPEAKVYSPLQSILSQSYGKSAFTVYACLSGQVRGVCET